MPIVEPEVLMDGDHTIERELPRHRRGRCTPSSPSSSTSASHLEGMLLKPNMVLSGYDAPTQAGDDEVAEQTLACFAATCRRRCPGSCSSRAASRDEDATAHLNAMNALGPHPWELSFSYGRALQAPALKAWGGEQSKVEDAQKAFYRRAKFNGAARSGTYAPEWETAEVA